MKSTSILSSPEGPLRISIPKGASTAEAFDLRVGEPRAGWGGAHINRINGVNMATGLGAPSLGRGRAYRTTHTMGHCMKCQHSSFGSAPSRFPMYLPSPDFRFLSHTPGGSYPLHHHSLGPPTCLRYRVTESNQITAAGVPSLARPCAAVLVRPRTPPPTSCPAIRRHVRRGQCIPPA
jgi:hypothetical protein